MVRNEKTFSRNGGQEPRLAGEVEEVRRGGGSAGQARRQDGKGPPERGRRRFLWSYGGGDPTAEQD